MKEALATAFIMLLGAFAATHASSAMGFNLTQYYSTLIPPVVQSTDHQTFVNNIPQLTSSNQYKTNRYVRNGINELIRSSSNSIRSDHQDDAWKRTIIDTIRSGQ